LRTFAGINLVPDFSRLAARRLARAVTDRTGVADERQQPPSGHDCSDIMLDIVAGLQR
jgi:hypothetical protein